MDPLMQKRQDDFLRNYQTFRSKAKEYIKNSKLEANLYQLSLSFEIDKVEHEIVLTLNLVRCLPLRENAQFRFASNSRLLRHLLIMARL